ncbi:MAG TPA: coproporphyrinogen III oxidase [Desulfobacteraceae bacterium]|nr:coproporphyrinogen III oxidase [Desulfobacteraceae bacterium]
MKLPGLYVHIPFCRSKCPYCGFYSLASTSLVSRWLDAFKKEVISYRGRFRCFDSLYLGGGTPTFLEVKTLKAVVDCLFSNFDFAPDTETTIEANPADLTPEKIKRIRGMGFNRINVGVQSFDDEALLFLGRRHTAGEAELVLKRLRSCGFDNIGIDLIYGFEGQSLKGWIETLKKALVFRPEHLSCYQLTFEKGTPFSKMKERGMIMPLGEEKECDFFTSTSKFLEVNGYDHYEISNFARKKAFYSRHNQKYWCHTPYLGLGPSAHSFHNSTRWWNVRSIRKYCEALENREAPVEGREGLTNEQMILESVALGLRTKKGFGLKQIGHDPKMMEMLFRLKKSGHIRIDKDSVVPTEKGYLVADCLPLYVIV